MLTQKTLETQKRIWEP